MGLLDIIRLYGMERKYGKVIEHVENSWQGRKIRVVGLDELENHDYGREGFSRKIDIRYYVCRTYFPFLVNGEFRREEVLWSNNHGDEHIVMIRDSFPAADSFE